MRSLSILERQVGMKSGKQSKNKRKPEIDEAISLGLTAPEISEKYSYNIGFVYRYIYHTGQRLSWKKAKGEKRIQYYTHDPQRDSLIMAGISAEKIGKKIGISKQAMYYYINHTGQKDVYKCARKLFKPKMQYFTNCLPAIIAKLIWTMEAAVVEISDDKKAYLKAKEYFEKTIHPKFNFENMFLLFKKFYDADKNSKITQKELAESMGMGLMTVNSIFARLNVEPMYHTNKKKRKKLEELIK